jgi:hypothetical protein
MRAYSVTHRLPWTWVLKVTHTKSLNDFAVCVAIVWLSLLSCCCVATVWLSLMCCYCVAIEWRSLLRCDRAAIVLLVCCYRVAIVLLSNGDLYCDAIVLRLSAIVLLVCCYRVAIVLLSQRLTTRDSASSPPRGTPAPRSQPLVTTPASTL